KEATQQFLALGIVESALGLFVFDQFDAVEVTIPSHVTDDRKVKQRLKRGAESTFIRAHMLEHALSLERIKIRQRDGRTHWMPTEGVSVREHRGWLAEGLEQPVAGDHRTHRCIARG